jgi:hypothetical protein
MEILNKEPSCSKSPEFAQLIEASKMTQAAQSLPTLPQAAQSLPTLRHATASTILEIWLMIKIRTSRV